MGRLQAAQPRAVAPRYRRRKLIKATEPLSTLLLWPHRMLGKFSLSAIETAVERFSALRSVAVCYVRADKGVSP
jgi:hypothetical protein